MDALAQASLKERYMNATESLIAKVRDDPNVIAVIVCGSLAYDLVWEKSDIDMMMVIRDQPLKHHSYCVIEDGITINVQLMIRSDFKRGLERNIGGSLFHSYVAKGKMVYTTDASLVDYFEDLKRLGSDDIALSALHIAGELIECYHKSRKWLTVRKDPLYAQYFILGAAKFIANFELCLHGESTSREAMQKAVALNPEVMAPFYQHAMSHHYSEVELEQTIALIDQYLEKHLDIIQKPVLEFMADREIKTVTLFANHFHVESHYIVGILDYLAEKGVIEKVAQTIRLTPKSRMAVEEIGFLYLPDTP